jgi:hypothetical protein
LENAAADDQAEYDRQQRMPRATTREEGQQADDNQGRDYSDERGPAGEEAEGDPGVLHVRERERPDDVHFLPERPAGGDETLGYLAGADGREGDCVAA